MVIRSLDRPGAGYFRMDLSILKYSLELFLLGGAFNLYEEDRVPATIDSQNALVEFSFGKVIFSCKTADWVRSWRVLSLTPQGTSITLHCARDYGRTACTLTLVRSGQPLELRRSRSEFASRLRGIIESQISGVRVRRVSTTRSTNSSGVHSRLLLEDSQSLVAGIAIGQNETQPIIDSTLTAGIVWLHRLKSHYPIERLLIFAPRGRATTIATRLCALQPPRCRISLYEVDQNAGRIEALDGYDQGDLQDRLRRVSTRGARKTDWPQHRRPSSEAQALINRIMLIAPNEIEAHQRGATVFLSIRGLEFARVSTSRGRIECGLGEQRTTLDRNKLHDLTDIVEAIIAERVSEPTSRSNMFYRTQAERWLESIIRQNVTAIDPTLDRKYVYSQVPAYRGEQRSYIDLLTITKTGRLVVIELKVSEDPDFPLQGIDYWLRVEWHRRRGDFQRRGYFAGLNLLDKTPLLYLVAPLFRFHATTGLVASCISKKAPVYRIGINEDWRNEVRVLLRQKLN